MARSWTGKGEYKRLSRTLFASEGLAFQDLALSIFRVIFPDTMQTAHGWTLDRKGVDYCVWTEGAAIPLVVQAKGFRVPEERLGRTQIIECRNSILRFKESGLRAVKYILLHNREGRDAAVGTGHVKHEGDKVTMENWTLEKHGDALEKRWGNVVGSRFPNYEKFWIRHIVPITGRLINPLNINIRPGGPSLMADLAPIHYKVFKHLSHGHEKLTSPGAFIEQRDIYDFYNYLYSVREGVSRFLSQTNKILVKYDRAHISDPKQRLSRYGNQSTFTNYRQALTRIEQYREQLVHDIDFIVVNGRIPRRECMKQYLDWSKMEDLRRAKDWEVRLERDFVDPVQQGMDDLQCVEEALNEVWTVTLREMEEMQGRQAYLADQVADLQAAGMEVLFASTSTNSSSSLSGVADFSKSGVVVPALGHKRDDKSGTS